MIPAPEVTAGAPSIAGPAPTLQATPPSVSPDLAVPSLPEISQGVTEVTGSLVSGSAQAAAGAAGEVSGAQQTSRSEPASRSPSSPAPDAPRSGTNAGAGSTPTGTSPSGSSSRPRRPRAEQREADNAQSGSAPAAASEDPPGQSRQPRGNAGSGEPPATAPTTRPAPNVIERIVAVVPLPIKIALGVLASLLALAIGAACRTRRRLARAERLAATDALTGLPNRRQADEMLQRLVAAARRAGRPLAVVLVDLDHFKAINDRFGHAAGDVGLRETGAAIRELLRASDHVARFGGEEFLVLLPDTSGPDAVAVAHKLRRRIAGLDVEEIDGGLSASLGVAALPEDGDDPDELIRAADAALYRAKENGRDRVESATEEELALRAVAAPAA